MVTACGSLAALDLHFDQAGDLFEAQDAVPVAAEARQHPAGADIGMAGEGHLGLAVENADPRAVRGILGRQDEGRLAEIELGRQ